MLESLVNGPFRDLRLDLPMVDLIQLGRGHVDTR